MNDRVDAPVKIALDKVMRNISDINREFGATKSEWLAYVGEHGEDNNSDKLKDTCETLINEHTESVGKRDELISKLDRRSGSSIGIPVETGRKSSLPTQPLNYDWPTHPNGVLSSAYSPARVPTGHRMVHRPATPHPSLHVPHPLSPPYSPHREMKPGDRPYDVDADAPFEFDGEEPLVDSIKTSHRSPPGVVRKSPSKSNSGVRRSRMNPIDDPSSMETYERMMSGPPTGPPRTPGPLFLRGLPKSVASPESVFNMPMSELGGGGGGGGGGTRRKTVKKKNTNRRM